MYLDRWDKKYWATYKVLDILQKVFYRSNPAREAFVELCEDEYVQKMTFDSYLYKTCATRPHAPPGPQFAQLPSPFLGAPGAVPRQLAHRREGLPP